MTLTDEQAAIRETVREFASEEIRPTALEADREQEFPEAVWDGLADLDLTGLTVPEEYGGYEADPVTAAVVNEEVAYGMLSVATALSVHSLATLCIAEFGSDAQQERWLPEMAEGRPVGAFALSEPHAGSNPAEMSTEARREGDEYVIDGEKQWITNGERAGVYVLFAKTDRDDPGSVTQFLVPADVDGLSVGEKEDKLGLRASDTTSLTFDDVRIPAANRLTEEGKGSRPRFTSSPAAGSPSPPSRWASHSVRSTRRWLTAKSATSSAAPFRTSRRSGTNSPRWRPKFGPRAC